MAPVLRHTSEPTAVSKLSRSLTWSHLSVLWTHFFCCSWNFQMLNSDLDYFLWPPDILPLP